MITFYVEFVSRAKRNEYVHTVWPVVGARECAATKSHLCIVRECVRAYSSEPHRWWQNFSFVSYNAIALNETKIICYRYRGTINYMYVYKEVVPRNAQEKAANIAHGNYFHWIPVCSQCYMAMMFGAWPYRHHQRLRNRRTQFCTNLHSETLKCSAEHDFVLFSWVKSALLQGIDTLFTIAFLPDQFHNLCADTPAYVCVCVCVGSSWRHWR